MNTKIYASQDWVREEANTKMNADNPVGTGSFSMNRKSGTTVGNYSHTEGRDGTASSSASHAEGVSTTASGSASHAEGMGTTASGGMSHAEGWYTAAPGVSSHAEGVSTTASGASSHAEGEYTATSAIGAHAEGNYTTASSNYQHVQGKYNIADASNVYAHIVGNGTSIKRSNAHTLDWKGVGWYQGGLQVGGTAQDGEGVGYVPAVSGPVQPGQVLSVKSVDENDKPTEWETVDTVVYIGADDDETATVPVNADSIGGYTIEGLKELIFDNIYPIGSIYTSINEVNPSNLFGGTWEQLKDRFLLGAGSTYTNGETGGSATHTLTVNEMPSHSHNIRLTSKATASGSNYVRVSSDGTMNPNLLSSTGGGAAHNNMPPYLVVYMWKRTA